ncbi:MAG TPA: 1-deoxy-D-xylulose-5-phosphate synthase N-terminal domain-containing protein [Actinokineospora sp.]|nr:1-deoxy-D-xylulose-5-phosphate synthase N-terminal domain-containing protein [Actinokineospora sp.]
MRPLTWLPTAEFDRVRDGVADPHRRCRAFAAMSRINTLYMIANAGSGHLGSSFSAADVVSWLLLEEMGADPGEHAVYFSSKGHDAPGLYAALIGLGLLDEDMVHRLRRLGGLPGHPDVRTPYMPFNTGSLGMGISKAKGLVLGNRLAGRRQRVFVLTGDGELQEGQNYEALAGAVHAAMGELTVVVDHNKIQSDTWVTDVSDLGDLVARFAGFGWAVLRCDGHDMEALDRTFRERAENHPDRPAVVIADTVKGAGCDTFAATSMADGEWRYRFHSGAPAPADYTAAHAELTASADALLAEVGLAPLAGRTTHVPEKPVAPAPVTLPPVYGAALTELAARDERVVALDADLVLDTGLIPFRDTHPERFIECGIAEQDMVSMAGGLAATGLLPFVHSFSCFLHSRPNEQIYNNASEGRKVVYVGSLAGVLPAAPGHSHQAVRDISAVGAVPGLVVLEPVNPAQTRAAVDFCAATADSVYLRLVSVPCAESVLDLPVGPLVAGRGEVIRVGGPVVAIGAGPVVLAELLAAAPELDLTVVNLPWLNRVDRAWLTELVADATAVVVVDNHYAHGGQADLVARALLEADLPRVPRFHGIGLTELPVCGTPDETLDHHALRADRLVETLLARLPLHSNV